MPKKRKIAERIWLGIDPGQKGGLVALSNFGVIEYEVMHSTEFDIWLWFEDRNHLNVTACIEKVHSMPKQGVASSFTFGVNYGNLRMALTAAGISFEEVLPRTWQKGLGIPPRKKTETRNQFKNRLRGVAQQLFPQLPIWKEPRSKGRQLAICDALLIAEFCKRKDQGKL